MQKKSGMRLFRFLAARGGFLSVFLAGDGYVGHYQAIGGIAFYIPTIVVSLIRTDAAARLGRACGERHPAKRAVGLEAASIPPGCAGWVQA